MYFERLGKDYAQALEYAELGLAKAGQAKWLCRERFKAGRMEKWEEKFTRRLERLRNRINRGKATGRLPLPSSTGTASYPLRQNPR
jgi:hypothetical protein